MMYMNEEFAFKEMSVASDIYALWGYLLGHPRGRQPAGEDTEQPQQCCQQVGYNTHFPHIVIYMIFFFFELANLLELTNFSGAAAFLPCGLHEIWLFALSSTLQIKTRVSTAFGVARCHAAMESTQWGWCEG